MAKEKTRELILSTASDLFYNQGYNLTGINEIIEEAGIAKATLYSHFKSKEDICLAYLDRQDQALIVKLDSFCKSKPKGNHQLIAVIQFIESLFNKGKFNGCWCIRTLAEIPPSNKKLKQKIKANKTLLLQYLMDLVKFNKPELKTKASQNLAKRIYLLYEGAVVESHLQNDTWPIKENIVILKTLLAAC